MKPSPSLTSSLSKRRFSGLGEVAQPEIFLLALV